MQFFPGAKEELAEWQDSQGYWIRVLGEPFRLRRQIMANVRGNPFIALMELAAPRHDGRQGPWCFVGGRALT